MFTNPERTIAVVVSNPALAAAICQALHAAGYLCAPQSELPAQAKGCWIVSQQIPQWEIFTRQNAPHAQVVLIYDDNPETLGDAQYLLQKPFSQSELVKVVGEACQALGSQPMLTEQQHPTAASKTQQYTIESLGQLLQVTQHKVATQPLDLRELGQISYSLAPQIALLRDCIENEWLQNSSLATAEFLGLYQELSDLQLFLNKCKKKTRELYPQMEFALPFRV